MKNIDITGKKFNRLTAIKDTGKKNKTGHQIWEFKCDCGKSIETLKKAVTVENTKSCGCIGIRPRSNILNKKFGKLTAIDCVFEKNSSGQYIWKFKCDCGNIIEATGAAVVYGDTRSCGCIRSEINYNAAKESDNYSNILDLYNDYKKGAKRRKIKFDITLENFKNIILQNCYYCDGEPNTKKLRFGKNWQIELLYNGVDRIDNNDGYILHNCVTCCKICNYMKHVLSEEEFMAHCRKIYNNFQYENIYII